LRASGRSRLVARWAALALLAAAAPAAGQEFKILLHERVPAFAPAPSASSPAPAASASSVAPGSAGKPQPRAAGASSWSFVAYGRQFDVELEPNEGLLQTLDPDHRTRLADVELYAGRLTGRPDSWVRLARHRGIVSGVIWDGSTLYGVETESRIARHLVGPGAGEGDVAIYRWQDTAGTLRDEVVAPAGDEADVPSHAAALSDGERLAAMTSPLPTPVGPGARLDVAIVADETFVQREGASAEATLLSMANVVDGIYVMQIGIHLGVADLVLLDAPGPFTQTDAPALLAELENYKFSNPSFRASGLAHLFTGRDLDETEGSTGQLVGIANIGVVCSARFGAALTQATLGMFSSALVAAHEIGHNFGAPHDGEPGSACAHEPRRFLMAASVTGSREFSQCSIEQMAPEVASATCLTPLPATNVSIHVTQAPPAEVDQEDPFELTFEIRNDGPAAAQSIEVTIAFADLQGPSVIETAGDSTSRADCGQTQPAYCRFPRVGPGETARYRVSFVALSGGPKTIEFHVTALNDTNASDNSASVAFDVRPFVDLASEMSVEELVVYGDEEVRLSGVVRNVGLMGATSVVAELMVRFEYDIVDIDAGGADCVLVENGYFIRVQCRLGALAAGAERPISWTLRPDAQHVGYLEIVGAGLSVFSAEPEPQVTAENNAASTRLIRTDAKADLVAVIDGAQSFDLGAAVQMVARIGNQGPDDMRDASVVYAATNELGATIDSISSSIGQCTVTAAASAFECQVDRLGAGDEMLITFAGTAESVGAYRLSIAGSSGSGDPESGNNEAMHAFTVVDPAASAPAPPPPPPPPTSSGGGGGGGGGAAGIVTLLGLLGAAALRGRGSPLSGVAAVSPRGRAVLLLPGLLLAAALVPPFAGAQAPAGPAGSDTAEPDAARAGEEPPEPDAADALDPVVELPEGEGRTLVQTACLPCHDLGGIAAFKGYWNREQWAAMVATMIGHGAQLDSAEAEVVVDYLTAHFGVGPDHRQKRETAE